MMILRQYRHLAKLVALTLLIAFAAVYLPSWIALWKNDGIVDYVASRDKSAIHKMFKDDWALLISDANQKTYSVDFMLDNRTPFQEMKLDKLVLKVLREDNKTVGFCAYYPKSIFSWQLLFLVIDKEYRRKGYASKMVKYMMSDMVKRGAIKITLATRLKNTRARALYENKFNFRALEEYAPYIDYVWYKNLA